MKKLSYRLFIFLYSFFLFTSTSFSQNSRLDSLKALLNPEREDTHQVIILNQIANVLYDSRDIKSTDYAQRALQFGLKLNYKPGIMWSKTFIAINLYRQGDLEGAQQNFQEALSLAEETGNRERIGKISYNLGVLYHGQKDLNKALECYMKSLHAREQLENRKDIAEVLFRIARNYYEQDNYEKSLEYYNKALAVLKETGDTLGIGMTYNNTGLIYIRLGLYDKALECFNLSLKFNEATGEKPHIASTLNSLAIAFKDLGYYTKALDYQLRSLKIREELDDTNGIGSALGNIGNIYLILNNYPLALDYYLQCLKLMEATGDELGIAGALLSLGNIYSYQKNNNLALDYYFRALKIFEKINYAEGRAVTLYDIGDVYEAEKDYSKAMDYFLNALELNKKFNIVTNLASCNNSIGNLHNKLKQYNKALLYLTTGLKIATETGSKDDMKESYLGLSESYSCSNDNKKALEFYRLYSTLKDSLINEETTHQLNSLHVVYDTEKKDHEIEILTKDREIKSLELDKRATVLHRQRLINFSLAIGIILSAALIFFIFRGYSQKKKANLLLAEKNKIIEEKNKEITDSITYAKRIQLAKLPPVTEIKKILPESFILYKPKDIVSGDFYWFHIIAGHDVFIETKQSPMENKTAPVTSFHRNDVVAIAAADCTGHGVPGAFMSMIGSEKLTNAVKESGNPGKILSLLNKGIKDSLRQSERAESTRDGMDIALCALELPSLSEVGQGVGLKYAGANRPLWLIRNGTREIIEIKATKKAIGGFTDDDQQFETHEIKLQKGDTFYMFSDGFADQFGGPDGKKLTTKKFRQLLLDIQPFTIQEQEKRLATFAEEWRANRAPIDDVLVIGIRI